jgi:hypothetical protein
MPVKILATIGLGFLAVLLAMVLLWPAANSQAQSSDRLVTVLSSARRITSTNSLDQVNFGGNLNVRGGYVILNVSDALTPTVITPAIQLKDPLSGNYRNLLLASTGVTTTGTYIYLVYPGIGAAGAQVDQVASYPLPTTWRVAISHTYTDPITYTVSAMLVN